jgi:hypothetical protein
MSSILSSVCMQFRQRLQVCNILSLLSHLAVQATLPKSNIADPIMRIFGKWQAC